MENHCSNATLLPASSIQSPNTKICSNAVDLGMKQNSSLTLLPALGKVKIKCPRKKLINADIVVLLYV